MSFRWTPRTLPSTSVRAASPSPLPPRRSWTPTCAAWRCVAGAALSLRPLRVCRLTRPTACTQEERGKAILDTGKAAVHAVGVRAAGMSVVCGGVWSLTQRMRCNAQRSCVAHLIIERTWESVSHAVRVTAARHSARSTEQMLAMLTRTFCWPGVHQGGGAGRHVASGGKLGQKLGAWP